MTTRLPQSVAHSLTSSKYLSGTAHIEILWNPCPDQMTQRAPARFNTNLQAPAQAPAKVNTHTMHTPDRFLSIFHDRHTHAKPSRPALFHCLLCPRTDDEHGAQVHSRSCSVLALPYSPHHSILFHGPFMRSLSPLPQSNISLTFKCPSKVPSIPHLVHVGIYLVLSSLSLLSTCQMFHHNHHSPTAPKSTS